MAPRRVEAGAEGLRMPNRSVERETIRLWANLAEAWWVALLPAPPLVFAAWLAAEGEAVPAFVMAVMFVFVAAFVFALLSPRATSIALGADGIELRSMGWRARVFLWRDIERFVRLSGRGGETLGWLVRRNTPGRRSDTGRRMVGADIVLPSYLCGRAAALEALLFKAQSAALNGRWAEFIVGERAAAAPGAAKVNGQGSAGRV
jgi:hypothetical protein